MKRRNFVQFALAAVAGIPILKHIVPDAWATTKTSSKGVYLTFTQKSQPAPLACHSIRIKRLDGTWTPWIPLKPDKPATAYSIIKLEAVPLDSRHSTLSYEIVRRPSMLDAGE